jgi:alginate O-acetyltransferase complex protein AlgI
VRNVLVVWFLTGLWHGASWNFCVWGLYFGVLLLIEKLFLGRLLERAPRILRHAYALLIVLIGWAIFELGSVPEILGYLGDLVGLNAVDLYNAESLYVLRSNLVLLSIAVVGAVPLARNVYERLSENALVRTVVMPVLYLLVLAASIAYVVDSSFSPFLYFRF